MEKLKATLAQYSRWQPYGIYVDRMEGHLELDFSVSVENAKALLEGIGKEICDAKCIPLANAPAIGTVLKTAFRALGYNGEQLVTQVSTSLANIGQLIGTLRNEISPTSHGKSLKELIERNDKIDLLTRDFLIDSTLVIAVFLIRAFEERQSDVAAPPDEAANGIPEYEENEAFNNFWDESFGDFAMGQYSYPASEILFNVDLLAYQAEYKAFVESEDEPPGEHA
ncbi:MAG: abortive infection family protein [Rhodoferax sp.]|nr:abortive infection family protein [Rhodoferax sp.]